MLGVRARWLGLLGSAAVALGAASLLVCAPARTGARPDGRSRAEAPPPAPRTRPAHHRAREVEWELAEPDADAGPRG